MHTLGCHYTLQNVNIICLLIIGTSSVLQAIQLVLAFPHSAWVINRQLHLLIMKHHQPSVHRQDPSAVHHRAMQLQWRHLHIQYYRHPIERFVSNETEGSRLACSVPNQHSIHGWGSCSICVINLWAYVWNFSIFRGRFLYLNNSFLQRMGAEAAWC